MIELVAPASAHQLAEIVGCAFERSFTRGQVRRRTSWPRSAPGSVIVAIEPPDTAADQLQEFIRLGSKIVLLGRLSPAVAQLAGIAMVPLDGALARQAATCDPAPTHATSQSAAFIAYADDGLGRMSPLRHRHLCRFDFTDEWNNLAYGRTSIGDDPWSIAYVARSRGAHPVAELVHPLPAACGAVATLLVAPVSSILWFARPVGPIDGADWRVIEAFIADHRADALPCRPHLRDIPHGVAAAITMRLDCDEDIASARPLWECYRSRRLPLSVAIKTGQPAAEEHLLLLADVRDAGGSILSHSVEHQPNWGGSAEAAEREARLSKAWLESHVAGLTVRYAVSPFHQNPTYVPAALARAGYEGFVGGSIANDPEYLMARGGAVAHGPAGIVSHSQSCMLHGDCMLATDDPIAIYKEAFRVARAGAQFFGFLDHPFSSRYAYGWSSEQARCAIHAAFLDSMEEECGPAGAPLLFVNEDTCLDFMRDKAATEIVFANANGSYTVSHAHAAGLPLSIAYRGEIKAVADA